MTDTCRDPGHYVPGSDGNHFWSTRCVECCSHYLSRMNLAEVEDAHYLNALITVEMLDGYRALWAEMSTSGANQHWRGLANAWTDSIRLALNAS